jgi:hypothetical protein
MPSTDDPGAIDGLTYSGAEWRRMDVLGFGANGSAAAMAAGIRPGDPGLAVSLAGSVINVSAGVAALYHTGTGAYRASFPTSVSPGSVAAADATNPRVDLVYLRVWDNAVDGTGLFKTDIVYLQGTAAVSPVAPTPGALEIYIPLATISVPKVGGGSASVSSTVRPVVIAPGGIAPSATAAGTYAGQYRDTGVAAGTLQRYNGTAWQDLLALAIGGQVNVGASPSSAALAVLMAAGNTPILTGRVTGDTANRIYLDANGQLQLGPGNAVADWSMARSAAGIVTVTGGLAVTGVGGTTTAVKSADTSRISTTTLAADPHLTMTLQPGTYDLDAKLFYEADTAADLKLNWLVPAGTTGSWWPGGADNSMSTIAAVARWGAPIDLGTTSLPVGGIGAGSVLACRPMGTVTITTAGTFALMWAQQASTAVNTILHAPSSLSMRRIS